MRDMMYDSPHTLDVCLCTGGEEVGHSLPGARVCQTHGGVTLVSLCEAGYSTLLHVKNDRGEVVPLTLASFCPVNP